MSEKLPKVDVLPAQACCFTGHRLIPTQDEEMLRQKLYECINELHGAFAISTFYAGGALGFDTMAAQAVLKAREHCHDIRLALILPYEGQSAGWSEADQIIYTDIPKLKRLLMRSFALLSIILTGVCSKGIAFLLITAAYASAT